MSGRKISYATKIQRHWGEGEGKNYHPWFSASEVSLISQKARIFGLKVGRIHLLLSKLEQDYFFLLDFSDHVLDIREQFPLKLEITQDISKRFGIPHICPGQKEVYTTDFLITKSNGELFARTLKFVNELNESAKEIQQKFAIEQRYYAELGIDWKIVTEEDFDRTRCRNIADCYGCIDISRYSKTFTDYDNYRAMAYACIEMLYKYQGKSLSEILQKYACDVKFPDGFPNTCNMVKHLIIHKIIRINMNDYINMDKPLKINNCTEDLELVLRKVHKKYITGNDTYIFESSFR